MCETNHRDEFIKNVLDHELWIEKADQLLEVASFIEPRIYETWDEVKNGGFLKEHYITTYFMLVAYALENLLKALYIKLNTDSVKKDLEEKGKLPKAIIGHDLYRLAKELKVVEMEWGEDSLLQKVSRSAVWFGRYPIPIKPDQLNSFYDSEFEQLCIPFRHYSPDDLREIQTIISRIRYRLNQVRPC